MKLEINKRTARKFINMGTEQHTPEQSRGQRRNQNKNKNYLETNENRYTYPKRWDVAKAVLKGKFTGFPHYLKAQCPMKPFINQNGLKQRIPPQFYKSLNYVTLLLQKDYLNTCFQ